MNAGPSIDAGPWGVLLQALSALGVLFLLAVKFGFFGGKRDAAVDNAVTEVELLKALELARHDMRGEINLAVGRCVSKELYESEHKSLEGKVDRLEKRFFNGHGMAGA